MTNIYKIIFGLIATSAILCGCSGSENNNNNPEPFPGVIPGTYPILSADGKSLTYGIYPQSNVNDEATINELEKISAPEKNGWYLYKNEYYVKINANPYANYYTFDNGDSIVSGQLYWFKCEPISWRVLSISNGEYFILTDKLLDPCMFYTSTETRTIGGKTIYPNNYEYSKVRSWLNDNFYNSAFNLNNQYIQTTIVDNSASTTRSNSNPYVCNNTEDKVFLLSYKDYKNTNYGFNQLSDRRGKTTDFARARGSYSDTTSYSYKTCGIIWTRSPQENYDYYAMRTGADGDIENFGTISLDYLSVQPAMNIEIA